MIKNKRKKGEKKNKSNRLINKLFLKEMVGKSAEGHATHGRRRQKRHQASDI